MRNQRVLVVCLAVLLAASLILNWVLWSRVGSRGTDVTAGPAATPAARENGPRERGDAARYEIAANPELQGRLGRVVVAFAQSSSLGSTRTVIYPAGGSSLLRADYGPVTVELPGGTYDLEICGKKLAGIPVEPGRETRVLSGVLRLHGSGQTRFTIADVGSPDSFHVAYGNAEFGLPAGDYDVAVSGVTEKITITAGQVTDF